MVERGDDEVPVGEGQLQPLLGQPARVLRTALVSRDKGDSPQSPRWHEIRALPVVALHGGLGDLAGLRAGGP